MATRFEAIYGNGVLRPLEPLSLLENEKVTLEIARADDGATVHRRAGKAVKPGFAQIRERFKHLPGCWADDVIDQRSDE